MHTLSSPSDATTPTNYHGIQWRATQKGSTLYVISDETGWWNVYEIEFDEKGICISAKIKLISHGNGSFSLQIQSAPKMAMFQILSSFLISKITL